MKPADSASASGPQPKVASGDELRDVDRPSARWRDAGPHIESESADLNDQTNLAADSDDEVNPALEPTTEHLNLASRSQRSSRRRDPIPDVVSVNDSPRAPQRTVLALTIVLATLVSIGIVAALAFGPGSPLTQPPTPGETPTLTGPPTPITLPDQFGTWSRKPDSATQGPTDSPDDLTVASATYTQNGEDSVVLIVAKPTNNMRSYLLSLGASQISDIDDGACAIYRETTLCGVVVNSTSYAVAPLADQTATELIRIAKEASVA